MAAFPARRSRVVRTALAEQQHNNPAASNCSPGHQVLTVDAIGTFTQHLNARDLHSAAACLAPGAVYENMAEGVMHTGRDQVLAMYSSLMSKVPKNASLCIQDLRVNAALGMVDVTWHVELGGVVLPWSQGTSMYWMDASGRITHIRDATEVPMSLALQGLALASPAIDAALPPLKDALSLPSYVTSMLSPQSQSSSADGTGSETAEGDAVSTFTSAAEALLTPLPSLALPSLPSIPIIGGWPQPREELRNSPKPFGTSASASPSNSTIVLGSGGGVALHGESTAVSPSGTTVRMRPLPHPAQSSGDSAACATASPSVPAAMSCSTTNNNSAGTDVQAQAASPSQLSAASSNQRSADGPGMSSPSQATELSGVWGKDLEASDAQAYEAMMDLLGLSGLQRVTARLIEGVEIKHVPGKEFEVSFLTVVPFFRVSEKTCIGYQTNLMRRDLRPGTQRAVAEELPEGGVRVSFDWGAPHAGALQETYVLEGDRMSVLCNLAIGDKRSSVLLVYKRADGSADALLRESRKRNSSMESVLSRQKAQFGWK